MSAINIKDAVAQILAVLRETFEGPADNWSYFTDNSPEAGYFGTLERINAEVASLSEGGSSIASHVHHVVFSLNEASAYIRGDRTPRDWKQSWTVQTVDDAAWALLLSRLRTEYSNLRASVQSDAANSIEAMGAAVGLLAHAAFHLGAIRQKAKQQMKQKRN